MKHPLESENEELRKRIEDTFDEIAKVRVRIHKYRLYRYAETAVDKNKYAMKAISNIWSKK
jgi:hypothetical protein